MTSALVLRAEAARYEALSQVLRIEFETIDQETLSDTLEGLTDLPDMLRRVIRSSLTDDALATALKARIADMRTRLERLEVGQTTKRALVCRTMEQAGLDKLLAEDFTVSRRQGQPKLEVQDEGAVPQAYLVAQAPRLDRAGIILALKAGQEIGGVQLVAGGQQLQVRTK